jgi:hypothetical protein
MRRESSDLMIDTSAIHSDMRRKSLTEEIQGKNPHEAQARLETVLNSLPNQDRAEILREFYKKPVAVKEKQSVMARLLDALFDKKSKTSKVDRFDVR